MSEPPWARISAPEETIEFDGTAVAKDAVLMTQSPIDVFYTYVRRRIVLGTPEALSRDEDLGKFIVLGLVSAVEVYLRRVLSGVVSVCPLSGARALGHQVSIRATKYYEVDLLALGIFEGISFASTKDITDKTRGLLGVQIDRRSSLGVALDRFAKVCHLRHAIVHGMGELTSSNAHELGLSCEEGRKSLNLEFADVQTIAAVCQSMVRAYNRYVYREIIESWLAAQLLTGVWKQDRERFLSLYRLFHSTRDAAGPGNPYNAYQSLQPAIRASAG